MGKIQLAYPKIPDSKNCPLERCIAFEKYDGTNLHWVWERELGWYAFGTRRDRFDFDGRGIGEFNVAHPGLEDGANIFTRDFADPLANIFQENPKYNCSEIIVFTEFFGENSFAGMHNPTDTKQLVLLDVQVEEGIINPEEFILDFTKLKIARVVYRGKLTGKFIHDVREGKYRVTEGVICKGLRDRYNPWMVKVKTNSYMERLQQRFENDWKSYWE